MGKTFYYFIYPVTDRQNTVVERLINVKKNVSNVVGKYFSSLWNVSALFFTVQWRRWRFDINAR
jgi:hypothetical protein